MRRDDRWIWRLWPKVVAFSVLVVCATLLQLFGKGAGLLWAVVLLWIAFGDWE